jgi:hypothetical protein
MTRPRPRTRRQNGRGRRLGGGRAGRNVLRKDRAKGRMESGGGPALAAGVAGFDSDSRGEHPREGVSPRGHGSRSTPEVGRDNVPQTGCCRDSPAEGPDPQRCRASLAPIRVKSCPSQGVTRATRWVECPGGNLLLQLAGGSGPMARRRSGRLGLDPAAAPRRPGNQTVGTPSQGCCRQSESRLQSRRPDSEP